MTYWSFSFCFKYLCNNTEEWSTWYPYEISFCNVCWRNVLDIGLQCKKAYMMSSHHFKCFWQMKKSNENVIIVCKDLNDCWITNLYNFVFNWLPAFLLSHTQPHTLSHCLSLTHTHNRKPSPLIFLIYYSIYCFHQKKNSQHLVTLATC